MDHYRKTLDLAAPATIVFDALTTQRGIEGWWTRTCSVGAGPGATLRVDFGKTFKVMRIEKAAPPREVRWRCTDSYLFVPGVIDRKHEWKDHEIVFRLSEPRAGVTTLDFQHIGLDPGVGCFEVCSVGWDQFLASLRAYVQTGKGTPFQG